MKKPTTRIVVKESDFLNKEQFALYKRISIETLKKEMKCTFQIPEKIYHFTHTKNIKAILEHGLKEGVDGGIFLSTSYESNLEHLKKLMGATHITSVYGVVTLNTDKLTNYTIIEAVPHTTDKTIWWQYTDPSKEQDTRFCITKRLQLKDIKLYNLREKTND